MDILGSSPKKNSLSSRIILLSILAIIVCLAFCGCGIPSYNAANEILKKYPNAELSLTKEGGGIVEFLVRTQDGEILKIVFADDWKMLTPIQIFPAYKSVTQKP